MNILQMYKNSQEEHKTIGGNRKNPKLQLIIKIQSNVK